MIFLTDFADEAVLLPVAALVAVALGVAGWWRGLAAWVGAVGGTLSVVLVLKAAGAALGDPGSAPSVSGHLAAACVVYGGIAVLLLRDVAPSAVLAAVPLGLAVCVGYSRVTLNAHSPAEALAGGIIGCTGVMILAVAAGPRRTMPAWPVVAVAACAVIGLHGAHLQAEGGIDSVFALR